MDKVINTGLAIPTDKDERSHVIAKVDKISIDGQIINSTYSLEEYIQIFDGGECIELVEGFEITKEDTIDTLIGELYQPCDDNGTTYADNIYSSEFPDKKIREYINDFLLLQIDFKMTDIKCKIDQIQISMEDGTFEWQ